jgi:hypothetical protein
MGEAGRGCRDATPFRITPERGQVCENTSKPGTKEAWDVFQQKDDIWKVSGQTSDVSPEARSLPVDTDAAPPLCLTEAGVLAGKASADGIESNSICSEPIAGKLAHVIVDWNVRPVSLEGCLAVSIDFTERDGSHSGSFKPEAEAANSREEIEDIQVMFPYFAD